MRISDWSSDVCSSDLRLQAVVVQAIARQGADLVVLDHDVGGGCQVADQRLSVWMRQVDRDGFLAAIGRQKIRRIGSFAAFVVFQEWRAPGAGVVAHGGTLEDRKSTRLNSSH